MFLAKEKALYMNLNMTRPSNNAFIGYFWAPVEQENTKSVALTTAIFDFIRK